MNVLVPRAAKSCTHFMGQVFGYVLRESRAPLFSESLSVQINVLRFPCFFLLWQVSKFL